MQNNYRGRLFKGYLLDAPWSFSALWSMVKNVIDESTSQKISISDEKVNKEMFTHIHPSQVEAKYGGLIDAIGQYWYATI